MKVKPICDFGGRGICVYTNKRQFSEAPTYRYGAIFVRGRKVYQNPRHTGGALVGCTDTDYFYFLCPKCGEVLQWNVREMWELPSSYPEVKKSPNHHIELEVWCRKCRLGGRVALSSNCFQGGPCDSTRIKPIEGVTDHAKSSD